MAEVNNGTGDRDSKLKLFYSTNGTAFTEITGTNLPYTARNNVASSASISVALPSALNNISTARLRLYSYSTTAGATPTGSQPKISIDNLTVTATPITPTTTTITPISAIMGGADFTLTVNGTNFISGLSTVTWGGATRTTTFVSSTQLTASISAADIAATGSVNVGVTTTGAAAVSNTQIFSIICPSSTATTGNWSAGTTWTCGTKPTTTTNVTIPTGVTVTLDESATINDLTFTGGGKLTLGANTLSVTNNVTGSATDGYVVTNGDGTLKMLNFAGEKTFPVGTATTYAPVKIDNSAGSRDFSVKVGTTFSGMPAVTAKMVQLEWNVTPLSIDGQQCCFDV